MYKLLTPSTIYLDERLNNFDKMQKKREYPDRHSLFNSFTKKLFTSVANSILLVKQ